MPTLLVVAALILVVRPLVAFLTTLGSTLTWQELVFIGWMHPSGIIAAATAASFGVGLASVGILGEEIPSASSWRATRSAPRRVRQKTMAWPSWVMTLAHWVMRWSPVTAQK